MADVTSIQWADSTVNPIMGCGGCELFPAPSEVLSAIDIAVVKTGAKISSRPIYKDLVNSAYGALDRPLDGHKNAVNTTNIWHMREQFLDRVKENQGVEAAAAAEKAIKQSITCYAATLHLNKGQNIHKPDYKGHKGHAPIFESLRRFPEKCARVARLKDLLGHSNPKTPWKDQLPRLIFVSDMGDALSSNHDFEFLKTELMPAITSGKGKNHLWLWLTKRPSRMAEFAEEVGGFPQNLCVMTTLTGSDEENLKRLADLKKVKAKVRGLSIEPLWERITPSQLDLNGIDWVILGGESGSGLKYTRPFALEWAEEIRDHCRKHKVAFFMKQLGRNPSRNGEVFKLRDGHGGNWDEWPDEEIKVREFPEAFHAYRRAEMKGSNKLRPVMKKKKKDSDEADLLTVIKVEVVETLTNDPGNKDEMKIEAAQVEFNRLNEIVRKGVTGFVEAGDALRRIQDGKLWRAGGFKTWEDYCRSVAGMSRTHAHRLIKASQCLIEMRAEFDVSDWPVSESQVRPLLRLKEIKDRRNAWDAAVTQAQGDHNSLPPTAENVNVIVNQILHGGYEGDKKKPPTRKEQRAKLFSKLRTVIKKEKSWKDVEDLLNEIEKLI